MNTPSSSVASDRPPKRLRLGTRSCAECRRRKIKCVFESERDTCNDCALHKVECVPQGEQKKKDRPQAQNVHQKLAQLEEMVRRIAVTMDLDSESTSESQVEFNAAEVMKRIQAASSHSENVSTSEIDFATSSGVYFTTLSQDTSESFADAPLLNLFREAMLIQDNDSQEHPAPTAPHDRRLASCIKTYQLLLPGPDDLNTILSATQNFWRVWQAAQGFAFDPNHHHFDTVQSATNFIHDSIYATKPARVAKAVLFIAMCIQQLPSNVANEHTHLPPHGEARLDSYLQLADMLLSISENSKPTIDGLECLDIIAKLYMNMGKPRESWLSSRRAINLALLLRLHTSSAASTERGRKIWSHLWMSDRHMSMLLGLPSATSDKHPGVTRPGLSIAEGVIYQMAVIAGHVNERNQNSTTVDYSTTIQIDQDLKNCLHGIPFEWWNARPSDSTPIELVYGLQVIKIHFYMLQKLLHQPYMLKSFTNPEYEPSNSAACEASREMIHAFQALRSHNKLELLICDLMDFQAFTAAMVLVIKLLWGPMPCNYRRDEDWALVKSVMTSLRKVSSAMQCSVASQAATILEYLTSALQGTYSGPSQFEAVIPYFGKVKINSLPPRDIVSPTGPGDFVGYGQSQFPSTIDFSANSFLPFAWNEETTFLSGPELGIDWTSLIDEGLNYDWSQHFDCSQMQGPGPGPAFQEGDGSFHS